MVDKSYRIIFQSLEDSSTVYSNDTDYDSYDTIEETQESAFKQLFEAQSQWPDQILIALYDYDKDIKQINYPRLKSEAWFSKIGDGFYALIGVSQAWLISLGEANLCLLS